MKNFLAIILCITCYGSLCANPSRLDTFRFGPERPKIGLVLSGGGAKGIAHVGTLKMLETLNIPIDYIGGTSMGAVVGGLYAMGYTADQLDRIVRETDWTNLFNDAPDREHIGLFEKVNNDPYQLRLSLDPRNISAFARGAISGQHIDNMLHRHLFEAYKTPDFSQLNIPFFCVATDLITSEYVILESGDLAQAIRASMAVPTVFTPVEINGKLLTDGGVVNNLPVLEMRRRGVDIIIGVDVGYQYKDKNELQNLAHILEQVMFMGGQRLNARNIAATDILITPDLEHLSAFSFSRYDTILQRGYEAAERAYPELRRLSDILSEKYDLQPVIRASYRPQTSITIDSIVVHGNKEYSYQYILQYLQLETRKPVQIEDVEDAIHRLFGSLSFTKVTYHYSISQRNPQHVNLHINVIEASLYEAKVGFHYDNIRGPAFLAGITAKNLLLPNSRFDANLDLSTFPAIDVQYRFLVPTHSILRPSVFTSFTFCHLSLYDYVRDEDSRTVSRTVEYAIVGMRAAVGTELSLRNNVFGLGMYWDRTRSSQHVGGSQVLSSYYWYPQLYYLRNSFNKRYYPTKGSAINAKGRILYSIDEKIEEQRMVRAFGTYYIDGQYAIPIAKKITWYPSAMIAGTFVFREEDAAQNHISQQQQFYQGGLFPVSYINQTPFVGLHLMQNSGLYAANIQSNLQYEAFRNIFLTARVGALKSEMDYENMFDFSNVTLGAGFSVSINTTVGPMGVTLHGSNQSRSPLLFINLGFWL